MREALEDMRSGRRIEIAKNRVKNTYNPTPIQHQQHKMRVVEEESLMFMRSEMEHQYIAPSVLDTHDTTAHTTGKGRERKMGQPSPMAGSPCDWFDDSEMW